VTSQNGHKRAVLYARVSTDEQAKGYSLPTQLEACRKYAEAAGYGVAATFQDDYTGTVPIEQRPEGRAAYAMLSSGDADALIVYRMDRLVRPPEENDEWDIPVLIRSLAKLGREIHTVDRGKLETSFAGLLSAVLDGKGAGDERRKIIERSMRGKRAKAAERWVGASQPPFGYAKIGKGREAALDIDDHEARIVRRIFNLYLGLDGEPRHGMDNIAVLLNGEGIPTTGRRKNSNGWQASTVNVILSNRAYVGEFVWGDVTAKLPDLAILERDIFERAQEQRISNRIECVRNIQHDYLLRGRLECTCGRRMSCMWVHNNEKDYQYYQCNRKAYEPDPACDRLKARTEVADTIVWDWLAELLTNPAKLRAGLQRYAEQQRQLLEPKRRRLAELPGLIAECEKQAKRLADSVKRVRAKLAVKFLEEQLEQVSAGHQRYTTERERLTAELESETMGEVEQKQIMAWAAEIREGIADDLVDFETKRQLIERLDVRARVEYQDDVRGLRLNCVLKYAGQWRALRFADDCSTTTVGKHEITFTDWLPLDGHALAAELFGKAARVDSPVPA